MTALAILGELGKASGLERPLLPASSAAHSEADSVRLQNTEDQILWVHSKITERSSSRRTLFWFVLLSCVLGCEHQSCPWQDGLNERILPPSNADLREQQAPAVLMASEDASVSVIQPVQALVPAGTEPGTTPLPAPTLIAEVRSEAHPVRAEPGPRISLPEAIALAFRCQPRLKASLESIQQARGREDIAFAAFLPTASTAYSVGAFALDTGGAGVPLPNSPPFTFIPFTGAVPIGLDIHTGYELAEFKLQWLICDFGRRLGRYNQAVIAGDIAQLQTDRAYQTVANDVSVAYYQVLRTDSLYRIAAEAVRRAQDDLEVARKLGRGGVIEREKVLRAEVAQAQALRGLDLAEEAQGIAVAALNLAVGINVSAATEVVDADNVPAFTFSLADCLQFAVAGRREFQVARASVQVAHEGVRVARADFTPRILAEGDLLDFQQAAPRDHFDLGLGFIRLEWGLFEGGKRVAEVRVADARVREALAEAASIADTISFQVNQAYHQMIAARKGIDRSRPAVELSRETYRLVVARSQLGDATPAELTDAEAALTRAEQDYASAVYDYLIALARLQYAMGSMPHTTVGSDPGIPMPASAPWVGAPASAG